MQQMVNDLITGPFINGLAQYGIGKGSIAGTAFIDFIPDPTVHCPSCGPTDENVLQALLINWIQTGKVPAPAVNEQNLMYLIVVPPDVDLHLAGAHFHGLHWHARYNSASTHDDLIMAAFRTDEEAADPPQAFANHVAGIVGHELVEAFNDPIGHRQELGDACQYIPKYNYLGKWSVQRYWSNRAQACIPQDLFWHNASTGELSMWILDGAGNVQGSQSLTEKCGTANACSTNWNAVASGDFNDDGTYDVLWQNPSTGTLLAWILDDSGNTQFPQILSSQCGAANGCSANWKVVGAGHLDNSGHVDVLWHNAQTGELSVWLLDGKGNVQGAQSLSRKCGAAFACSTNWKVVGVGDLNGDGHADVLWQNVQSGQMFAWLLDGSGNVIGTQTLSGTCGAADGCSSNWKVVGLGDFNNDGPIDVLWHNAQTGQLSVWLLDGTGTVIGLQSLTWQCGAASGCSQAWRPVGVM
jgi:hypothetical protein